MLGLNNRRAKTLSLQFHAAGVVGLAPLDPGPLLLAPDVMLKMPFHLAETDRGAALAVNRVSAFVHR